MSTSRGLLPKTLRIEKADAAHRAKRANGRGTIEITRFKGLGEMMPTVLWETAEEIDV